MTDHPLADLLADLERYYDDVPRAFARTEEIGPFTLFVTRDPHGWPYYARPRLGYAEGASHLVPARSVVRDHQSIDGGLERDDLLEMTEPPAPAPEVRK